MAVSFMVTAPELVSTAAGSLASIGSTIEEATAAAEISTTGLAAAAADEVSTAASQLFGNYGQEFQAVIAKGAAFHSDFVRLLSDSAAAYLDTDIANAEQSLRNEVGAPAQTLLAAAPSGAATLFSDRVQVGAQAVSGLIARPSGLQALESALSPLLWTPGAAAAAVPGGAYGQLVANTAANLQALTSAWSGDPFPFLRQFLANQLTYAQGFGTALASFIQNFPANFANLPAAIQAGVQQFLSFNAAYYLQQFIATQIGFAEILGTSFGSMVGGLVAGLPDFASALGAAFGALLVGDYTTAVDDLGRGVANLLVTNVDPGPVTVSTQGLSIILSMNPKLIGPLGDLFTIMNLPGQEAQYLTNLTTEPMLRHLSQNFTNVLNTLTLPSITTTLVQPLTSTGTLNAFFGLPLVFTYAAFGGPFSALNQLAISLETFEYAIGTGNLLGAVSSLVDAPANTVNGFLNVHNEFDMVIQVPTGFTTPFPADVTITLHVPVDGILVQPHPLTATVDPHLAPIVNPFEVTVFGTPFMGFAPLLVNYIPQQLALAIKPAA